MSFGFNPYTGDLVPTYTFDMTKLIAAHFDLGVTSLYRQTSVESYIVDNDGNFVIFG